MSVYVDPLKVWGGDSAPSCFRHKPSCHLYADSLEELHRMAAAIGMKRSWFQDHPVLPHYDLVPSRRAVAVRLGAIEQTPQEMAEFLRLQRAARLRERYLKVLKAEVAAAGLTGQDLQDVYNRLALTTTEVLQRLIDSDAVKQAQDRHKEQLS